MGTLCNTSVSEYNLLRKIASFFFSFPSILCSNVFGIKVFKWHDAASFQLQLPVLTERLQSADGSAAERERERAGPDAGRAGPGVRNNTAQSRSTALPKHSHQGAPARAKPDGEDGGMEGEVGVSGWADTKERKEREGGAGQ